METLSAGALAFGVALGAAPIVLWALRRARLLDLPSARSSHRRATPRGGGVAPAIGCLVAASLATQLSGTSGHAIVAVSACLGLIGLADDLHPRRPILRLLGQAAVALAGLIWLGQGLGGGVLVLTTEVSVIVIWLVGYVNAFNFMDGINGLAAAQVVVAGVSWWIIGSQEHVPALAAAGLISSAAAVAFAPFNVPHAKMFLGDVGSYFFGGWLAVAAIVGLRAGIAPEAVVAPLAVFLADTGITLLQRVRRHESWTQPHKEHAYQRLVLTGWSHGRTTLSVGMLMAVTSALGGLSLTGVLALRVLGDTLALAVLAGYLKAPALLQGDARSGSGAAANP